MVQLQQAYGYLVATVRFQPSVSFWKPSHGGAAPYMDLSHTCIGNVYNFSFTAKCSDNGGPQDFTPLEEGCEFILNAWSMQMMK